MFATHVHDELAGPTTSNKIIKAENSADLDAILAEGVGAVILQRQMPEKFLNWIGNLSPDELPSMRKIIPVEQIEETIREELGTFDKEAEPQVDYLIQDANKLAQTLAEILNVSFVRIRFDVVNSNACRLFHIDHVQARLICTYRGRGTQYGLRNDQDEPDIINEIQTGELILLRGTKWASDLPSGIVHRSPSIEGSGETRLILVIDPISDPKEEA